MTPLNLIIIDRDPNKILAIKQVFDGVPKVTWMLGDINALTGYDCLITPGNSFGIMDGGFDDAVRTLFGDIERRVQHMIECDAFGELHVGDAAIVIPASGYPKICYAPTMRVPMQITRTDNVYCAMRAALGKIHRHNMLETVSEGEGDFITTVATPVLGSGAGNLPAAEAARQMRLAWDSMKEQRKPVANLQEADAIQAAIGLGLGGDPDHY